MDILDVCREWSFWQASPPASVLRTGVLLPETLDPALALIVQGVRRCGKSTFLAQLLARYSIPPERALFVNFEDPRIPGIPNHETLDAIVNGFVARWTPHEPLFFFFDEVQGVAGWEKWLHCKLERNKLHNFVLTGSNSTLLSGELSTVLAGRYRKLELFPFSFSEYLELFPMGTLESYLKCGGFPKVLQLSDSRELLQQYFQDIVERDIRERVRAKSSLQLRLFVRGLFDSTGSETSVRRLSAVAGISADTAAHYLEACENAYLIFSCAFFAFSEAKSSGRNKKYYPVDTGLRKSVSTNTTPDIGKDFETYVMLVLRKKYGRVFYWKGKNEVDFVIHNADGIRPIQVSWDGVKERHLAGLDEFYREFPMALEAELIDKNTALSSGILN